ncbi:MAG: fibronectin type III domain-containing protein, partial [Parafilimonas sp.]|nr:fibronectin type III domain-containing protein [Parafilimonas sp.]
SRSASFNISVVDKDVTSVYLNFSDGSLAGKPWNNLAGWPFAGTTFNNLNDDNSQASGITVTFVNGFQGVVASGLRPGNGKGVYPEVVMRTAEFEGSTNKDSIKISGLSSSKKYNFVFFNSHDDGLNGLTNFTINGQTVSLNATNNLNKTVQINGITPDANGNAMIAVAKGTGADYAYISSLIIQSYSSTISTLSPTDLRVTDTKRTSVTLQWQDRAYNETGYEVWRATTSNNQYTLLKSLGANVTSYTDAGLTANTTYYYMVRAVNGSTYSTYSNAVAATTYSYSVYLNFTDVNQAPIPWNNLNSIPQNGYTWSNFIDETNMPTSIGMQVTNTWAGLYSAGMNTGNNSAIFPDNVMIDSYGLFPGQTGTLKVTGLNMSLKYDFTFFASSQAYGDVNVAYTINGKTVLLNTSLNTNGTVTLYGVVPDINGEVNISVAPGTATSQFGLIGAMIIQGYNESTAAIPTLSQSGSAIQTAKKSTLPTINNTIEVTAYPNPFRSAFNLSVNSEIADDIIVQLFDISGKQVYQNKFSIAMAGNNTVKIEMNNTLPKGVYVAKIIFKNQNTIKTLKLLRQ